MKIRLVVAVPGRRARNTMVQTPAVEPEPAATVPPVQVSALAPSLPPHVPPLHPTEDVGLAPSSTIWLPLAEGRVSVKLTLVTGEPDQLLMVTVKVVHWPGATWFKATVLPTVNCALAVKLALAAGLP